MQFLSVSCYCLDLRPKYPPQYPIANVPPTMQQTKIDTDTKQAKLELCVLILMICGRKHSYRDIWRINCMQLAA